jgi:very-short-patch-repair endonuclease
VIEVDGGQHYEDAGKAKDETRSRYLEAHGLRVVRFSDIEVLKDIDAVLAEILLHTSASP